MTKSVTRVAADKVTYTQAEVTSAITAGDPTVSATTPSSPAAGDQWFDTTSGVVVMKVWSGTQWDQLSNPSIVYTVATGGTITTQGNYKVHTFTSSGTFTVSTVGDDSSIDSLIVAGGGSGGVWSTGSSYAHGLKGSNSSFNSQTANGSGGGKGYNQDGGSNTDGGSGGGASGNKPRGGSGTNGQGNSGGNVGSGITTSGGGGGAGAAGQRGQINKHGDGGAGLNWKTLGTFYAGGGGGGGSHANNYTRGLGGAGGGGAGGVANSANPIPVSGSVNTGGGGGGGDGWYGQNHGGGGGGGYIGSSSTISASAYGVVIGAGGASVGNSGPATQTNMNVLSGAGGSGIAIIRYVYQ